MEYRNHNAIEFGIRFIYGLNKEAIFRIRTEISIPKGLQLLIWSSNKTYSEMDITFLLLIFFMLMCLISSGVGPRLFMVKIFYQT